MAKTTIFVQAVVAAHMERISSAGAEGLPIQVLAIQPVLEDKDMREVTVRYQTAENLFLFGMLAAKAWAEEIKASMEDDKLYNLKFRG